MGKELKYWSWTDGRNHCITVRAYSAAHAVRILKQNIANWFNCKFLKDYFHENENWYGKEFEKSNKPFLVNAKCKNNEKEQFWQDTLVK